MQACEQREVGIIRKESLLEPVLWPPGLFMFLSHGKYIYPCPKVPKSLMALEHPLKVQNLIT